MSATSRSRWYYCKIMLLVAMLMRLRSSRILIQSFRYYKSSSIKNEFYKSTVKGSPSRYSSILFTSNKEVSEHKRVLSKSEP